MLLNIFNENFSETFPWLACADEICVPVNLCNIVFLSDVVFTKSSPCLSFSYQQYKYNVRMKKAEDIRMLFFKKSASCFKTWECLCRLEEISKSCSCLPSGEVKDDGCQKGANM